MDDGRRMILDGLVKLANPGKNRTKASVKDVEEVLSECLMVLTDQFQGLNGKRIDGVSVKASQRPKSVRVSKGDVFMGIVEGRIFYGRVIAQVQLGTLLEFWDLPSDRRLTVSDIKMSKAAPILHRYVFSQSLFSLPNWHLIGKIPVSKTHNFPVFFNLGGSLSHPLNKKVGSLTIGMLNKLEPAAVYHGHELMAGLSRHGLHETWDDTIASRKEVLQRFEQNRKEAAKNDRLRQREGRA